ncbi:MAG: flagellar basal body rod protein FlgB [Pseudomonadota bacterium]
MCSSKSYVGIDEMDNLFGIHADALKLRANRAELLAANIANADTPNFKARDIDFEAMLNQVANSANTYRTASIERTHQAHLEGNNTNKQGAEILYRTTLQPTLDGNTVDLHAERSAFMENSMQYQATLRFLNGKINGLKMAIRGEL